MPAPKGMIFAAGIGSRLRPLTDTTPKALIEVGGITMLERTIDRMIQAGVSDITVNIHHHSSKMLDFISRLKKQATIHVSDESGQLLDTGGGLLAASRWLNGDSPILIHNADILSQIDFNALLHTHLNANADATLAVQQWRHSSRMLHFSPTDRLIGWENTKTHQFRPDGYNPTAESHTAAFSGIHVITPKTILPQLEQFAATRGPVFSIIDFYLSRVAPLAISSYNVPVNTPWHDIGRPETLAAARLHPLP